MKNLYFKKGFTLIELLVVVAIIGILSSVVLAALNNARSKGADAAVKANLNAVRSQAELFYSNNNNSYLPSGGSVFAIATCPTPYNGSSGANMVVKDKTIFDAIAEATNRGQSGNSCYNSTSQWAVAVGLKNVTNTSWCVDSSGTARQYNGAPSAAINSSTFVCN